MTKDERLISTATAWEKGFFYGLAFGILIMSQIAGILGNAGYEIPAKYTIARLWSNE